MARIRSVYPSLWTDEAFLDLSLSCKLFVIALWSECDDGGAFQWKPKQLKVRLFGCDTMDVQAMLAELQQANFIRPYEADGTSYGAVRSFGKFQKPQKPTRLYPMPADLRAYAKTEKVGPGVSEDRNDIPAEPAPRPEATPTRTECVSDETGQPPASDDYDTATVVVASGEERRGEEKEDSEAAPLPSAEPPPIEPRSARDIVWQDGVPIVSMLTGKGQHQCRPLIGKWLRDLKDDCPQLMLILQQAQDLRPADPSGWISRSIANARDSPCPAGSGGATMRDVVRTVRSRVGEEEWRTI